MGLDIYVGPLTRYHRGDWETIVQRLAREGKLPYPVRVVRASEDTSPPLSEAEARSLVLRWRADLSDSLKEHMPRDLDWNEAGKDYFTDKPSHECWSHLLLWAAYSEHPDLQPPATFPVTDFLAWEEDPAFQRAYQGETRYPQLLHGATWWLPCDFRLVFRAADAAGVDRVMGSVQSLIRELNDLNERTWKAGDAAIASWYGRGTPEHGCAIEEGARFAFGLTTHLAREAAKHRYPMLLDY